ncbi:MAG: hypothetical protein QOD55_1334 [Solirubrobacteraceae bacterium]|nr:hypothetical protein [Solirubrobacteraceae bacterium]
MAPTTPVSFDDHPELRRFVQDVREAEARRGDLVADAGHELKTPLSIILGLSGRLLAASDGTPAQQRDLERIRASAYGLLKHADDLLQAARMDSGRVAADPVDCDVAWLVHGAATSFSSLLEERDQRLVLRTPGRLPARADDAKLLTILTNLMANAVRYAPPGGVVRCSLEAGDGRMRIEVADSGPGVPPGDREAVFERYRQVAGAAHRRPGGTGLGLAIVRDLVTLLGGTVSVGDAPEGGALFAVELDHEPPAAPAQHGAELDVAEHGRATIEALRLDLRAQEVRPGGGWRTATDDLPTVLLVEQRATLGGYLEELLGEDYDVRRATTADEAAATAASVALDAVVVDVGGAGGEATLDALRVPSLDGVPVVVLAADAAQAADLVRGTADDYAVLPFAETLLVRLGAVIGRRRAEAARAEADARFRAVFEQAPGGMALATPEGRLLEVNAAFARLLGLPPDAMPGLTLDDLSHPGELGRGDQRLPSPGADDVVRLERRLVTADARVLRACLDVSAIRQDGELRQLVVRVEETAVDGETPAPGASLFERVLGAQLARCAHDGGQAALLLVELADPEDGETIVPAPATVASAIRRRLRRSDVVVADGARRLAAIVVDAGAEEAAAVADDVRGAVRGVPGRDGRPLAAAVGVCAVDGTATAAHVVAGAEAELAAARTADGALAAPE